MKYNKYLPEKSVTLGLIKSPWGGGFEVQFIGREVADLCAPAMDICPTYAEDCEASFINLWLMLTVPALKCKQAFETKQNAATSTLSKQRLQQSGFHVLDEYTDLSNRLLSANMLMHLQRLPLTECKLEMKRVNQQTANLNGSEPMVTPSLLTPITIWLETLFKSHLDHHVTLWNDRRLRGVPISSNRFLNFT